MDKFRKAAVFIAFAIVFVAGCHHDSNTITGPSAATPVPGVPTPTPMSGAPTPTPAPAGIRMVNVGQGGGTTFADQQSGGSTTTIPVGTTVQWVWVSGFHSTTSGTCAGICNPDGVWNSGTGSGMTFSHTFNQAGNFPYFCMVHQSMMTGNVVVR
jgi:plastocyanin